MTPRSWSWELRQSRDRKTLGVSVLKNWSHPHSKALLFTKQIDGRFRVSSDLKSFLKRFWFEISPIVICPITDRMSVSQCCWKYSAYEYKYSQFEYSHSPVKYVRVQILCSKVPITTSLEWNPIKIVGLEMSQRLSLKIMSTTCSYSIRPLLMIRVRVLVCNVRILVPYFAPKCKYQYQIGRAHVW